ncbi:HEAT repeat domain-containing protein [Singulisphaera acidiphila]|uniref:HEAT repeat-containing protein n=1 Tax=Singulisphaera acidiphila (strain ATCC BAA-1392 / DSM 18658 / VKM B-2454 / MOB10) TaxID=886293 RepID=L0DJW9_SINAD|nr:HEAT repeat domain-containing protein [Singulisphaera acidiphila]AGA29140.1 HEAT repeat-containing protein [Singulisphaera acidiphila DSM 18658]
MPMSEREKDRVRRSITPPVWSEDRSVLVWTERQGDGDDIRAMMWRPEDAEERAEAERFFQAATYRSWHTEDDLREILKASDSWLIRLNMFGVLKFLTVNQEDVLFGPDIDEIEVFADVPAQAATFTAEQTRAFIPRLAQEWLQDDQDFYFEPIRPAEATRDFRLDGPGESPEAAVKERDEPDDQEPEPADLPTLFRLLEDPDEGERIWTASRLAKRGIAADRVVPVIVAFFQRMLQEEDLGDYDTEMWFCGVAYELANYGANAAPAIPVLIEALGNRNWQVMGKAAYVLGHMGAAAEGAIPALKELLHKPLAEIARHSALESGQEISLELAEKMAASPRVTIAEAFWNLTHDEAAVAVLLEVFRSNSSSNDRAGAALGRIGTASDAVIPALIEAVRETEQPRPEGQSMFFATNFSAALGALETIGPAASAAVPAVTRALADPNTNGRIMAARTLWRLTGSTEIPLKVLVAALEDPSEYTRRFAAETLGSMGAAAVPALPALRRALDNAVGEYKDGGGRQRPEKQAFEEASAAIEGRGTIQIDSK